MGESLIHDVSDTAFMVAAYRAQETRRPDALFSDPLAERLAGAKGQRILETLPGKAFMGGWTVIIRTRVIDAMIESAVASGIDTVLNLGAGLDTRPYRMPLPRTLRWIEADYAHVVHLKEERLKETSPLCDLQRVAIDLSDAKARRDFLTHLAQDSKKVLVLTEGVVPYLSEMKVGHLADDLHQFPVYVSWIVDYFSKESYRYRRRSGMSRVMKNAPFLFEPQDYFGFFAQHGWIQQDIRYLAEEGAALGRPFPLSPLMKAWLRLITPLVPPQRRKEMMQFAGFVQFKRN